MTSAPWVALLVGGLLAGGIALLALARLRRGDHRRVDDDVTAPPPRNAWLVPTTVVFGALVALERSTQKAHVLLVILLVVMVGLLGVLSAIDIDVHRLPNSFTRPMALGTAVVLTALAALTGDWTSWRRALLAGLLLGAVYLVLAFLGGATGMGMGDVKLAPTLGMLLGQLSWSSVLIGTAAAFIAGGVFAAALLLLGRADRKTAMPFGPAMALGAVIVWVLPPLTL